MIQVSQGRQERHHGDLGWAHTQNSNTKKTGQRLVSRGAEFVNASTQKRHL